MQEKLHFAKAFSSRQYYASFQKYSQSKSKVDQNLTFCLQIVWPSFQNCTYFGSYGNVSWWL